MKRAVLDLGTNTFHVLIADISPGGVWKKVLQKRITVKLGKGGINRNRIAQGAYTRGMNALKRFRYYLDWHHVKNVKVFGTAALRTADNGTDFIREARQKYKLNIISISGDEEARLICLGVRQAVKITDSPVLIMDIGGGSVEFIICDQKKMLWRKSYKAGAALLLEKFSPSDPITQSEITRVRKFASTELKSLFEQIKKFGPDTLIGSAGSFETMASMIRHRFPDSGSHYGKTEHNISLVHFKELYKALIKSTIAERKKMKGLIKMRIDMIVLSVILTNLVLEKSKVKKMKLSTYSLKEGALYDIMN
jgi:exopolyphosphatase / guanosine-5'-triphosphate,3'-diphosphate pyrophosphatase